VVFDIVTLFPGMFLGPLEGGVLARARSAGLLGVRVHDLRRFGLGRHRQVDDVPYGGGGGMILRPEPLFAAVEWIRERYPAPQDRVLLLSPQGIPLDHRVARELAGLERLILLCGRYEGVDDRVREGLADGELSIGDVVVSGGEVPALLVLEAVARFVPGVLGRPGAAADDSFAVGGLEPPYYTRPLEFRGLRVPEILVSGNHEGIARWRSGRAREVTCAKRPDLLEPGDDARDARGGEEG